MVTVHGTLEKVRLLIVDDDLDGARSLSQLLAMLGVASFFATNPAEAIALASRVSPQIILLDLCMPGMDGFAVVKSLRDLELSACRIVALSGFADRVTQDRCKREGFDHFVAKPAKLQTLQELIGEARQLQPRVV